MRLLGDDFDELMALAGRLADDVREMLVADQELLEFLRTAKARKLSGKDLVYILRLHAGEKWATPAVPRVRGP
jgi:hypothetical protein